MTTEGLPMIPIYAGTTIPHVGLFMSGLGSDCTQCVRCWGFSDDYRHRGYAIHSIPGVAERSRHQRPLSGKPKKALA